MVGLAPFLIERPTRRHRRITTPHGTESDPGSRQVGQREKARRRAHNKQARKQRRRNRE